MGMLKATKAATAAIENKAPAASSPPKIKRVMRIPTMVFIHTALTGVFVCLLTRLLHQEKGKQPSRAYANVTRDAATCTGVSYPFLIANFYQENPPCILGP